MTGSDKTPGDSNLLMTPANRQSPRQKRRFLLIALAILASVLIVWAVQSSPPVEYLEPEVLAEYPHDTSAYTQGLLWRDGILYESTGKYGSSALRKVDLESGRVLQSHHLGDSYFGEGLERVGDRLIQLTWDEKVAFVYDLETFQLLDTLSYRGEGWGLCFDGERLFMSNGSDTLLVREPQQFLVVDRKRVTLEGRPVSNLNELECVDGSVWANIWNSDRIVRIDPADGRVTAVVDASNLYPTRDGSGEDVLNGIAYIPERRAFLLTGKNWPRIFEVRFVPE